MEIIIGDEHGRGKFCNIYNKLKDDSTIKHFVCVGDYFDPYFCYKEDASDLLEKSGRMEINALMRKNGNNHWR